MSNTGNLVGVAVTVVVALLGGILGIGFLLRLCKNCGRMVRTSAEVIRKEEQTIETRGRMQLSRRVRCYTVVFSVGGEERMFSVSEASYRACTVGRRGTLCYRGRRFLDFS